MLKSAWDIDTSTLTKVQLGKILLEHGCTISVRCRPGDFKLSDRRQILVDLLHSKLPVPPPHDSVTTFLVDVKNKAVAEGTAAVLTMSSSPGQPRPSPPPPLPVTDSEESSEDTDSECNLSLNVLSDRIRAGTRAASSVSTRAVRANTRAASSASTRAVNRYQIGDRIDALYEGAKGGELFFAGHITVVHPDGTYDIDYDDGDRESNVSAEFVRDYEEPLSFEIGDSIQCNMSSSTTSEESEW